MRLSRMAALGASMLVLISACSTGGSSPTPKSPGASSPGAASSAPATSAGGGATIATKLVLGGPPECPQRPFCGKGLKDKYGLEFKEFKPLDVAGPLTVAALDGAQIDIGLLLTSDPLIAVKGYVLLQDDKQLQLADNIVPVVRQAVLDASPDAATVINSVTAKLSQEELTNLNKAVNVDKQDADKAAKAWLEKNGFLPGPGGSGKGKVVVGSTNFYEQEVVAELYAQTLAANGFDVSKKLKLGAREAAFPALEAGQIDLLVEYAATALEYVNKAAGEATTDAKATVAKLNERLKDKKLAALDPAAATDQNGFVVTKATADKYSIKTLSDLAKPAP